MKKKPTTWEDIFKGLKPKKEDKKEEAKCQ
jgi:hypothetical protein